MKEKFKQMAVENFKEGYSCSESIAKAAFDSGIIDNKDLISVATSFSGGLSSRCACGALTGAELVIGFLHGKLKDNTARELAKKMYDKFISLHKVACCKVLSSGFDDFHSAQRRAHCINMVADAAEIMYNILQEAKAKL